MSFLRVLSKGGALLNFPPLLESQLFKIKALGTCLCMYGERKGGKKKGKKIPPSGLPLSPPPPPPFPPSLPHNKMPPRRPPSNSLNKRTKTRQRDRVASGVVRARILSTRNLE